VDKATEALVILAKQGDLAAFEELVSLYRERVYRIAFRVMREKESALDVAQEAFIRVHAELRNCRGEAAFGGWLYRLVTNLAIDHYRRAKRRRFLPLVKDFAGEGGPDRELEAKRAKLKLAEALDCLTDRQKKVFVLKHYQGLNTAEISGVIGAAEGTVKATLHQAMNKMREFLESKEVG
jgi:RNA polymerase sigma-70 factor (ECF subfamily)